MAFFIFKIVLSGLIIASVSWLAGKNAPLAGFLTALPLMSVLGIAFAYWQYRDMEKLNEYAVSIVTAVPLSLVFFLPFILNRWLKMNFALTYGLAFVALFVAYAVFSKVRGLAG